MSEAPVDRFAGPLRSFGRRKGRPLSPRQQHLLASSLPRLRLDPSSARPQHLSECFGAEKEAYALEIGFGGAEHLIWQAKANAATGYIGCEPFVDGIAKALVAIEEAGLSNIRLFDDDVRELLPWLPPASLDQVFILFPDPWPKSRHAKRRLISKAFVADLVEVMKPGATLRFATDIDDYLRTALLALLGNPELVWQDDGPGYWRNRGPDWPQTRYERKAGREGRRCYYLTFQRRT